MWFLCYCSIINSIYAKTANQVEFSSSVEDVGESTLIPFFEALSATIHKSSCLSRNGPQALSRDATEASTMPRIRLHDVQ